MRIIRIDKDLQKILYKKEYGEIKTESGYNPELYYVHFCGKLIDKQIKNRIIKSASGVKKCTFSNQIIRRLSVFSNKSILIPELRPLPPASTSPATAIGNRVVARWAK